jgi:hypothetical protein
VRVEVTGLPQVFKTRPKATPRRSLVAPRNRIKILVERAKFGRPCDRHLLRRLALKNKRIIIGLCFVAAVIAGLAFRSQNPQGQRRQTPSQAQAIPDYEVYRQLFHHHVTMKRKADELEKQGKDGTFFREFYRRQAQLSDDQARVFDEVASRCEEQVAEQDAKAKAIVDAALAQNGGGKLANGARPPEPPPELRALWDERNAIILRAKDSLQTAFGDGEFARFENYVKQDVVPHLSPVPPSHPRPSPMGPRHTPRAATGPTTTPGGR